MKMSKLFYYSDKNYPSDAELKSDRLFRKANILVKTSAGEHIYTPILFKSLRKLEKLFIERLSTTGAQEVRLPSARCSEDVFHGIGRKFLSSYKQLPLILFQINNKFSDVVRSKFGIIQSGESLNLDIFIFEADEKSMSAAEDSLMQIISDIFSMLNVPVRYCQNEFVYFSDEADELFLTCSVCGYSSGKNSAVSEPAVKTVAGSVESMTELHTPDIKSVKQLVEFTRIPEHQMIKTIIYKLKFKAGDKFTAVLMRGDLDVNESKLKDNFSCDALELASADDIVSLTGAEVGFAGPFGLNPKIEIIGDNSITGADHFLCGLNKTDYHNINVCFGRDIPLPGKILDIHMSQEGDTCALCKTGILLENKGFKAGRITKFGTAVSNALNMTVDNKGSQEFVHTSSISLNLSALLALTTECNCDDSGSIWPASITPFNAVVIPADKDFFIQAENCYNNLLKDGFDVLFDDRDASPGFKFKDADLIGIPLKIIFGKKVKEGSAEIKVRGTSVKHEIPYENISDFMKKIKLN